MTPEQVRNILDTICEQWDGKENAPMIEIDHGLNRYTPIQATYPAWELSDGILRVEWSGGTRWIDCDSITSIGI